MRSATTDALKTPVTIDTAKTLIASAAVTGATIECFDG